MPVQHSPSQPVPGAHYDIPSHMANLQAAGWEGERMHRAAQDPAWAAQQGITDADIEAYVRRTAGPEPTTPWAES